MRNHADRLSKWLIRSIRRQTIVNGPIHDGISYFILILTRSKMN